MNFDDMRKFKKLFFPCICCNGTYIATIQISRFPAIFVPSSYIEKVIKAKGTPFVIYKNNQMDSDTLVYVANDIRVMSVFTGLPMRELIEFDTNKRIDLIKNSIYSAVCGFILTANSKNKLFDIYENLKSNFKDDNISINNTCFTEIDYINNLKKNKVIYDETFRKIGFSFSSVSKYVTDGLIEEIKKLDGQ